MRLLLISLLLVSPSLVAQQPAVKPQPAVMQQTQAPRVIRQNDYEFKVGAGWYSPDFTAFNEGFAKVERALGVRSWGETQVPYFVGAEAHVQVLDGGYVVGEAAFGMTGRSHGTDDSWMSVWRGGIGFRMQVLPNPLHVSVQATTGMTGFHASRSYDDQRLFLKVAEQKWYLAGSCAVTYDLLSRTAIEFNAGYLISPSVTTVMPEASFKLSGPTIGVGIMVMIP